MNTSQMRELRAFLKRELPEPVRHLAKKFNPLEETPVCKFARLIGKEGKPENPAQAELRYALSLAAWRGIRSCRGEPALASEARDATNESLVFIARLTGGDACMENWIRELAALSKRPNYGPTSAKLIHSSLSSAPFFETGCMGTADMSAVRTLSGILGKDSEGRLVRALDYAEPRLRADYVVNFLNILDAIAGRRYFFAFEFAGHALNDAISLAKSLIPSYGDELRTVRAYISLPMGFDPQNDLKRYERVYAGIITLAKALAEKYPEIEKAGKGASGLICLAHLELRRYVNIAGFEPHHLTLDLCINFLDAAVGGCKQPGRVTREAIMLEFLDLLRDGRLGYGLDSHEY